MLYSRVAQPYRQSPHVSKSILNVAKSIIDKCGDNEVSVATFVANHFLMLDNVALKSTFVNMSQAIGETSDVYHLTRM